MPENNEWHITEETLKELYTYFSLYYTSKNFQQGNEDMRKKLFTTKNTKKDFVTSQKFEIQKQSKIKHIPVPVPTPSPFKKQFIDDDIPHQSEKHELIGMRYLIKGMEGVDDKQGLWCYLWVPIRIAKPDNVELLSRMASALSKFYRCVVTIEKDYCVVDYTTHQKESKVSSPTPLATQTREVLPVMSLENGVAVEFVQHPKGIDLYASPGAHVERSFLLSVETHQMELLMDTVLALATDGFFKIKEEIQASTKLDRP